VESITYGWKRVRWDLKKKKSPVENGALLTERMEAGGIEPPSRDVGCAGLYMRSRCFAVKG